MREQRRHAPAAIVTALVSVTTHQAGCSLRAKWRTRTTRLEPSCAAHRVDAHWSIVEASKDDATINTSPMNADSATTAHAAVTTVLIGT